MERSRVCAGGGQVHHWSPLPEAHGAPRRGEPAQHREDEADLPAAEPIQRTGYEIREHETLALNHSTARPGRSRN